MQVTLEAFDLNAKSAREAAQMAVGHAFSDDDWNRVADRWERVWQVINPTAVSPWPTKPAVDKRWIRGMGYIWRLPAGADKRREKGYDG